MTEQAISAPWVNGNLGDAMHAYLEGEAASGFAGTVLAARSGEVVLHHGYGLVREEPDVAMSIETTFDIGSISKMFTGAAILKLADEGRLAVSDPITEHFGGVPDDKAGITIHHLLTHTAGIELYSGEDDESISRDDMVRRVLDMPLQWPPGTRYRYSNPSYALLGAIIELITGEPYEAHVQEQFFKPAGMQNTGYVIPRWDRENMAGLRDEEGTWISPLDTGWLPDGPGWNMRANGGMLSTAADLYRWHMAMQSGQLLSEKARSAMFTPYVPSPSTPPPGTSTGYGLYISKTPRGTSLVSRGGTSIFGCSSYWFFADEDAVLILATRVSYEQLNPIRDALVTQMFSKDTKDPQGI